jgi:uncharacterized membrane protein
VSAGFVHGMRPTTARAAAVSRSLRARSGAYLVCRRWALVADLIAMASLSAVTLYQAGVLRHLPDPPVRGAASDRVAASPPAYWVLHAPDAALGMVSYASTLLLATAGGADRYRTTPWLSQLFAAKLLGDGLVAVVLLREERRGGNGFCSWCMVASAAALLAAPLGLAEGVAATRVMRRTRGRR